MTIFRVLSRIHAGKRGIIPAGHLTELGWLTAEQTARLVELEVVAEASLPPLTLLAGWKTRGATLAKSGIVTVSDYLKTSNAVIAEKMHIRPTTAQKWRCHLQAWLASIGQPLDE